MATIGSLIAGALAQAQAQVPGGIGYVDATLTKKTATTRTTGQLTAGTNPTSATYACKAVAASRAQRLAGQILTQPSSPETLTRVGEEEIYILGSTIASGAVPTPNDTLTIDGATYALIGVKYDQVRAVYICAARGL